MIGYHDELIDADAAADERHRNAYQRQLYQNFDCRDPAHPGCFRCEPDDEEDEAHA